MQDTRIYAKFVSDNITCKVYARIMRVIMKYEPANVPLLFIIICNFTFVFFLWRCDPTRVMAFSFLRFLDHTQRRTTFGRIPLDE